MDNATRKELLYRARAVGYPGSILDVFANYDQGKDLIAEFEQQQQMQRQQQMSDIAAQRSGLEQPQQQMQQPQQQMPVVPSSPIPAPNFTPPQPPAPIGVQSQNSPMGIVSGQSGPNQGRAIFATGGFTEEDPPDWRNILNYKYSTPAKENLVGDVRKIERPTAVSSTTSVKSAVPVHMVGKTKEEVKAVEADWQKAHEEQVAAERAAIIEREKERQAQIDANYEALTGTNPEKYRNLLDQYEKNENTGEWIPKSEHTKKLEAEAREYYLNQASEGNVYRTNNPPTAEEDLIAIAKEIPYALLGTGIYSRALGAIGKAAFPAAKNIFGNVYRFNPMAGRLNQYNRVVGSDAIADLRATGLVRSGEGAVTTLDGIPVSRPTAWPSFANGAPRQTYVNGVIQRGDTPFIISTNRAMGVSTLGRHGKGSTYFPVGENGKYLTSFPASEVSVYEAGNPHWLKGYKRVNINGTKESSSIFGSALPSFSTELKGAFQTSKAGRQAALDEANKFSTEWAQAPNTYMKYNAAWQQRTKEIPLEVANEFPTLSAAEQQKIVKERFDELALGLKQAYEFKGRSAEYPLGRQALDLLTGDNIHTGNWGVSYYHTVSPTDRAAMQSKNLIPFYENTRNWVSRTPRMNNYMRTSTGIHENTHDWIDYKTLVNSGQDDLIRSFRTAKTNAITDQWSKLRQEGKSLEEIEKIMGKRNADIGYFADPTEVHARLMEIRNHFDFKPETIIDESQAAFIKKEIEKRLTPVDPKFLVNFKTPEDFRDAFNKLFTPTAIIGGTGYLYNKGKAEGFKTGGFKEKKCYTCVGRKRRV